MYQVELWGEASHKCKYTFSILDPEVNLLEFLQTHNVPIASSCSGKGLCEKCIITCLNKTYLSCKINNLKHLVEQEQKTIKIYVSYF